MWQRRSESQDRGNKPRGVRNVNQNAVFFDCEICGFRFQDNPNQDFVECPQCGCDDTRRV